MLGHTSISVICSLAYGSITIVWLLLSRVEANPATQVVASHRSREDKTTSIQRFFSGTCGSDSRFGHHTCFFSSPDGLWANPSNFRSNARPQRSFKYSSPALWHCLRHICTIHPLSKSLRFSSRRKDSPEHCTHHDFGGAYSCNLFCWRDCYWRLDAWAVLWWRLSTGPKWDYTERWLCNAVEHPIRDRFNSCPNLHVYFFVCVYTLYMNIADLSKWKITSGTLLYTFLRKKHQPSIKEVPRWHGLLLPTGRSTVRPTSTENPSHEGQR